MNLNRVPTCLQSLSVWCNGFHLFYRPICSTISHSISRVSSKPRNPSLSQKVPTFSTCIWQRFTSLPVCLDVPLWTVDWPRALLSKGFSLAVTSSPRSQEVKARKHDVREEARLSHASTSIGLAGARELKTEVPRPPCRISSREEPFSTESRALPRHTDSAPLTPLSRTFWAVVVPRI